MPAVPRGGRLLGLILTGALLTSACSDDATGPSVEVEVSALEVLQRGSGEVLAGTHGAGSSAHWHGHIHLQPGQATAFDLRFLDADGSAIPLGGDYAVDARLAPGSASGVVTVEPHGDHVDVEAVGEGVVGVIFSLRRGSTVVWDAPVLEVEVEEEVQGPSPSDVASIRLDHRDGSGHVSHTHGTGAGMEWHGDLHLHPGDTVELDVTFRNATGDTLRFFEGDEYTLGAALAPGSAPGVVELDVHGDHLQVIALGEGEVSLVLSIDHGDHSDFDSPPLLVEVEDHHSEPGAANVASIRLMDRESGEELAHTHGAGEDMHWHGHLHLHPGDEVELELVFRDADGAEVALIVGARALAVALAEGSAAGIVQFAAHGDHIDLEAVAEGEVEVAISVVDGDEVVFAVPHLAVEVVVH